MLLSRCKPKIAQAPTPGPHGGRKAHAPVFQTYTVPLGQILLSDPKAMASSRLEAIATSS